MATDAENAELKAEIAKLSREVADLRNGGALRGSKAEALFALEYDTLPDWYKSPRAIRIFKRINELLVYILIVGIAVIVFLIWKGPSHSDSADLPKITVSSDDVWKNAPKFDLTKHWQH